MHKPAKQRLALLLAILMLVTFPLTVIAASTEELENPPEEEQAVQTVTLVLNGGRFADGSINNRIIDLPADGTYALLFNMENTPSAHGFTFYAWYTTAGIDGTRIFAEDDVSSAASRTLYARWTSPLDHQGALTGRVHDKVTGKGIEGVTLQIWDAVSYPYKLIATQTTNTQGFFNFPSDTHVWQSAYVIIVTAANYGVFGEYLDYFSKHHGNGMVIHLASCDCAYYVCDCKLPPSNFLPLPCELCDAYPCKCDDPGDPGDTCELCDADPCDCDDPGDPGDTCDLCGADICECDDPGDPGDTCDLCGADTCECDDPNDTGEPGEPGEPGDHDAVNCPFCGDRICTCLRQPIEGLETHERHAYLIGFCCGNIRPDAQITRAEAATIFFRLMADSERTDHWAQTNPFPDVTLERWYNNAVSTTTEAGFFVGRPDGSFAPQAQLTRAEFAAVVVRARGVSYQGPLRFDDIYGHWAADKINTAAAEGWIHGFEDGTFQPDQYITRAEVAAIINRKEGRVSPSEDAKLAPMLRFPDNTDEEAWYYLYKKSASNSYLSIVDGSAYDYGYVAGLYEFWVQLLPRRDWAVLERPDSNPEDILS